MIKESGSDKTERCSQKQKYAAELLEDIEERVMRIPDLLKKNHFS